jgi:hypothetical protein
MKRYSTIPTASLCLLLSVTQGHAARVMENLGRGVIAVRTSTTSVYVGWRMLASDPTNVGYNLYRSTGGAAAVKLNSSPLTTTTDYVDSTANLSSVV